MVDEQWKVKLTDFSLALLELLILLSVDLHRLAMCQQQVVPSQIMARFCVLEAWGVDTDAVPQEGGAPGLV